MAERDPQIGDHVIVGSGTTGWTAAEYAACPDLAGRLHSRILDLEDEVERLRNALAVK